VDIPAVHIKVPLGVHTPVLPIVMRAVLMVKHINRQAPGAMAANQPMIRVEVLSTADPEVRGVTGPEVPPQMELIVVR